ncbi:MAG: hypothetical protein J0I21_02850 [Alphaproteobacteria bacterium]|nr:hypothetical protein [Alphaproteobacteria bacterium]
MPPAAPVAAPAGRERQFLDAAERATRFPRERLALVLHLSRLRPPGPRPHHRRVADALLRDAAERHEGQVFALGNEDRVLLCETRAVLPPRRAAAAAVDPVALPALLGRLLRPDAPDPAALVSLWPLATAAGALLAYAQARLAEAAARSPPPGDAVATPAGLDALGAALRAAPPAALTRQHFAAQLQAPADGAAPLRPLWREITFSLAALEARAGTPGQARGDPFLLHHLAPEFDRRLLGALATALGSGTPLDPLAGAPMHLKLSLATVLDAPFADFAAACHAGGAGLGVAVPLTEAGGDPDAFARARRLAATGGWTLLLDDVPHLALLLTNAAALGARFIRLAWSATLPGLPENEARALAAALRAIGPERVVLTGADAADALRWGAAWGIRRFQGRHVDTALAAMRMRACSAAGACTPQQCRERATATDPAGRRLCRAPRMLAAGAPAAAA